MANGRERSMEFWFEFDNFFNPSFGQVPAEVFDAYSSMPGIDFPLERWREHRRLGTYPDGFGAEMISIRDPLLFLSAKQVEMLDRHFAGDPDSERTAFEQFGQGVLFDDRRPVGDKVHKMDTSGPDDPPVGYHRWHPLIRAAVMVGRTLDGGSRLTATLVWHGQSSRRPGRLRTRPTTLVCRPRVSMRFVLHGRSSVSTSSTRPSTATHFPRVFTAVRPCSGHEAGSTNSPSPAATQ